MTKLILPFPPSTNRLYRIMRGRAVMSAEARQYKLEAACLAKVARLKKLTGDLVISIDFYRPRKSGDIDNRIKVTLDSLEGILFEDDKQIAEIHARRFEDKKNPRVEIEVWQLKGQVHDDIQANSRSGSCRC